MQATLLHQGVHKFKSARLVLDSSPSNNSASPSKKYSYVTDKLDEQISSSGDIFLRGLVYIAYINEFNLKLITYGFPYGTLQLPQQYSLGSIYGRRIACDKMISLI